jgi:four helix bundle protein
MLKTLVKEDISSTKWIKMAKFRFEDLEIWKEAISIALIFFDIADELEQKKLWRFADQCRGVGMSIPNNISESTGTNMKGEQQQLLRYAKRECYEGANILVMLELRLLITRSLKEEVFDRLDLLSRRIQAYSDSLK